MTRAILLDIEGTTTSIRFVHEVLFPYAKEAMAGFVQQRQSDAEIAALINDAREHAGELQAPVERVIDLLLEWIAQDKKVTALKALQGHIWEAGYKSGDFRAHVYQDTAPHFDAWRQRGIDLYVYSSGSVQAQELLFGHSDAGDLRRHIRGYFDTRMGNKRELASYQRIAQSINLAPNQILFLSDVEEELDAAKDAGMHTTQLVRDADTTPGTRHRMARDFSEVEL